MSTPTADTSARGPPGWAGGAGLPGVEAPQAEGLRERKKRLMRQQLSDTATRMFLERGFDAVRVSEIAEACGVSEKTVFNYFPTKEALILDRLDATVAALRTGLADPGVSPVRGGAADPGRRTGDHDVLARGPGRPGPGGRVDPALRRADPGRTVPAGPSERHDGSVRRRGRRRAGRAGRDEPGRPGAADRRHRPARAVAGPVPGPGQVPGRHPHPGPAPPGRQRRRPPRGPAHRHRPQLVPGVPAVKQPCRVPGQLPSWGEPAQRSSAGRGQRSRTRSPRGWEQQISALPPAGSSTGSGR